MRQLKENDVKKSILTKSQTTKRTKLDFQSELHGCRVDVIATIRYDDECGNGHNSFAITGTVYEAGFRGDRATISGGCVHDSIIEAMPELEPFIKWHFMNADEPMYYLANTLYHASDCNYDGLKEGEHSAYIRKVMGDIRKDGQLVPLYESGTVYTNKKHNSNLTRSNEKELCKVVDFAASLKPSISYYVEDFPCEWSISEGKPADLEAARRSAIWPEAELEDFTKEKLLARLPALLEAFQRDLEALGFVY